ncbi:MAG: peptide deformylase [Solirubrobacterales bacterium]
MAVKDILLLGNENLYKISRELNYEELSSVKTVVQDLHETLMDFRRVNGFGRAIAAPQIDAAYRILYMNYGNNSIVFINPRLEFPVDEKFEIWDDCMSFPNLEVKVERYKECIVFFRDLDWKECSLHFEGDLAELIQHEYDHLDGILAVQRAVNNKAFRIKYKE